MDHTINTLDGLFQSARILEILDLNKFKVCSMLRASFDHRIPLLYRSCCPTDFNAAFQ
jgi:hypothetical protein